MLRNSPFYARFAVDDISKAKEFYGERLGVEVIDMGGGLLSLRAANGYAVLIYPKDRHEPAAHVVFEHYDEGPLKTNEKGIATPGPKQAWFRDPAGNILSVIEG